MLTLFLTFSAPTSLFIVASRYKQLKDQKKVTNTTIGKLYNMKEARNKVAHDFKVRKLENRPQFVQNFRSVITDFQRATTFDPSDSDYVNEIISHAICV